MERSGGSILCECLRAFAIVGVVALLCEVWRRLWRTAWHGGRRALPRGSDTVGIDEVLGSCRDGDVLIFSGTGHDSAAIQFWSSSRWTHVGMVLRLGDRPYLWHSDVGVGVRDAVTGKKDKDGPQLSDLEVLLRRFTGTAVWRPLIAPAGGPGFPSEKAEALVLAWGARGFNRGTMDLLRAALGSRCFWDLRAGKDMVFCSQMLAEAFGEMGILRLEGVDSMAANLYHPCSFTERAGSVRRARWASGWGLGKTRFVAPHAPNGDRSPPERGEAGPPAEK